MVFSTQLEVLERPADYRQTPCHAGALGQALTVLAQHRVIVFGYELERHLKSACIETRRHAATVRLGRSPPLLAGLAAPDGDGGGADPEAAE